MSDDVFSVLLLCLLSLCYYYCYVSYCYVFYLPVDLPIGNKRYIDHTADQALGDDHRNAYNLSAKQTSQGKMRDVVSSCTFFIHSKLTNF